MLMVPRTYTYIGDEVSETETWNDGLLVLTKERPVRFADGTEGEETIVTTIQSCPRGLVFHQTHSERGMRLMVWACGLITGKELLDAYGAGVYKMALNPDNKLKVETIDLNLILTTPAGSRSPQTFAQASTTGLMSVLFGLP